MFSLCQVSDYLKNSFVYIGKDPSAGNNDLEKELGKTDAVVPKMKQDLCRKTYHLYVDNWYTSEKLSDHLKRNGTNGTTACGTERLNQLKVPPSLKRQEMKKGDNAFR